MTEQQRQHVQQLHAQGALNRHMARALNVSEATIKRWKQRLGLGNNCPRNQRGRLGEQLFIQEARKAGWPALSVSEDSHPFDVAIRGLRVEVKTAQVTEEGWRFRLPRLRPSFHSEGQPTPKDYVRDCDLLALVGLDEKEQLAFIYLLPPPPGKTDIRYSPATAPRGINWHPLAALATLEAA